MQPSQRITRVSRRFRLLFTALIIALPIGYGLFWVFFNELSEIPKYSPLDHLVTRELTASDRLLGFLVTMIPAGVVLLCLFTLARLFRLYEAHEFFTANNVKCFRRLGHLLFVWVLARLIYDPLIAIALTYHNAPGSRQVMLTLDSADLPAVIVGGLLLVISWIMDEARKLQEDQAYTI